MGSDGAIALHELETAMLNVAASQYLFTAGVCVLVYDHLLTLAEEAKHIWNQKWTFVSFLFLVNRYISPVVLAIDLYDKGGRASVISHSFCLRWYYIETVWNIMSFGIVHAIVALRVHAIWGRPRWLSFTLSALFLVYSTSSTAIALKFVVDFAPTIEFEPGLHVCLAQVSPYLWTCWIPSLLFESFLFVLTVLKSAEHFRKELRTPVLRVLYRDGMVHFTIICLCNVSNMMVWILGPPSLVALAKYFTLAIVPAMGARLVLNLKGSRCFDVAPPSLPVALSSNEYELHAKATESRGRPICTPNSQGQATLENLARTTQSRVVYGVQGSTTVSKWNWV